MAKPKFTVAQMADALRKTKGMTTKTAELLGCYYTTVQDYLNRYPELEQIRKEAHNTMGDEVELALYDLAVKDKNPTALIFLAKTKFSDRGYTERLDLNHSGKVELTWEGLLGRTNATGTDDPPSE